MRLVLPSIEAEATYESYLEELNDRGEPLIPWVLAWEAYNFRQLVERLHQSRHAAQVDAGRVPHSTYWLLDEEDEIIGVSNLRHRLNPQLRQHGGHIGYSVRPSRRRQGVATKLLRLTLDKASAMQIPTALLFCRADNVASRRVIERNGGRFDGEMISLDHGPLHSFWITLAKCPTPLERDCRTL